MSSLSLSLGIKIKRKRWMEGWRRITLNVYINFITKQRYCSQCWGAPVVEKMKKQKKIEGKYWKYA
jgi:hypothetical protein